MNEPIVFIDDEPALCRIFSLALKRLGREVITFTDPVAAVAWLTGQRAGLVICDYRMPGLTGLEVLERMPEEVPFVLISGDLAAADTLATRKGVTTFLPKPLPPQVLLATVGPLLAA